MHYTKQPISPADAVQRLIHKGLVIPDQAVAEKLIRFISYFRLRGYCLPFMQTAPAGHLYGTRVFNPGTTWNQIHQAYECDRILRNAITLQLERIEVAFRSVIADHMAHTHGSTFYGDVASGFATCSVDHMNWLIDCMKEIKRSGEHSIKSYLKKYTKPGLPPSWYVTEVITFTKWSMFYKMLGSDKGTIAKQFSTPQFNITPDLLDSWMHALSVLRNMCSHHSRLFGKRLTLQPAKLKKQQAEFVNPASVYTHLAVIQILSKVVDGNGELRNSLSSLQAKFPLVDLECFYGIPRDWHLRDIWQ